jgi:penicillin-binding protein 1A
MGHDQPRSLGDRESGGGLALPIWIDTMRTMLRGVPVQPLQPPGGVSAVGGDWRYDEWAGGLFVPSIDVPDEVLDALAAERAQAAASAPEGGASSPR